MAINFPAANPGDIFISGGLSWQWDGTKWGLTPGGAPSGGGVPEAPNDGVTYGRESITWQPVLPLVGGTLTGPLTLHADPVSALQPVTLQYLQAHGGGGGGASVTVSDVPPASPAGGDLWWDNVSGQLFIWFIDVNSSAWVISNSGGGGGAAGGASVTISDTAPINASAGDLWWDNVSGQLFIWFTDANSSQWIIANSATGGGGAGGATITISDTAPASPTAGALWFDSVGVQTYLWFPDPNSDEWVPLNTPPGTTTAFLPLIGGALTGPLTVNAANPQLVLTASAGQYATIRLSADAGQGRQFQGRAGALNRWNMYFGDATTETGSNVGTNFTIGRFDDTGAFIDNPLTIHRSDASAYLTGPLTILFGGNASYFDTKGNLGVGIPVPALQGPASAANGGGWIFAWGLTTNNISGSLYYDGTNWRAQTTGAGSYFYVGGGTFSWNKTPAGAVDAVVTPTAIMQLDASGTLHVGNSLAVNDPLQVYVANGYYARTYYTVAGTRSWTCGVLSDGNFSIADESYPSIRLQLDQAGGAKFVSQSGQRLDIQFCAGIGFTGCPNATDSHSYVFSWASPVSTLAGISVDNGGAFYGLANGSDARLKTEIAVSGHDYLATINAMPVHEFYWLDIMDDPWKLQEAHAQNQRAAGRPKVRAGVIAQEIAKVFPEGVHQGDSHEDHLGIVWGLDVGPMFGLLIGAMQQQSALIETLTARMAALEGV
jgi:hypothetical protein